MQVRATGMATGGDAVARTEDGKVTFVTGALPGELVEVEVVEERKDFRRSVATIVHEPSADRTEPPCPHLARGCGGCGWQHVDLSAQRRLKIDIVLDALRRIGKVDDPHVKHGPHLPPDGFRTTIRVARGEHGTGFRHARSHEIVDVDSCLVAHPLLVELLGQVDLTHATEATLRCGARTGDRLVLGDGPVRAPEGVRVGPKAWLTEIVAGEPFRIGARSFFQARPDGADALVALVHRAADDAPEGRMVDAYGGVGLFAKTVGARRRTTLVEWSASSVHDARHNVPDVDIVKSDVARWKPSPAALVVADPPRTGLGKHAARTLAATGASHLVLVSCDPASLARDARILTAEHGFRHDGTTLVDLFPHTPHVECVTRFIR
jgi:23S rRNA (uracil1939-C5)-methyltransferase